MAIPITKMKKQAQMCCGWHKHIGGWEKRYTWKVVRQKLKVRI